MPQKFTTPYPPEFRAEAVRLVREGSRSPAEVAQSLGVFRPRTTDAAIEQVSRSGRRGRRLA